MHLFNTSMLAQIRLPVYTDIWSPFCMLIVVGTSLWVFIDGAKNKVGWWFLGGLLVCGLWLIFFPIYLVRRRDRVQDSTSTIMWVLYFLGLFCVLMSVIGPEMARRSYWGR